MEFVNVPKGGEVIASMQMPHPLDNCLHIVLVKFPDNEDGYATWLYSRVGGFSIGNYFPSKGYKAPKWEAYKDFVFRCKLYIPMEPVEYE